MNQAFFNKLTEVLTELTADLQFLHKPTGTLIAPQIIGVCLERKTGKVEEGDAQPFVRWMVATAEFRRAGVGPLSVVIDSGIYTNGTTADGNADIATLAMAIGGIVKVPWFSPYKLSDRVPCSLGSRDQGSEGLQPHPYYYARHELTFVGKGTAS